MENEDKNMKVSFTPNPQGALRVLAFLVLASLFVFLGARAYREMREARSFPPQNVITISGKGSIFATPDIGQVVITVAREQKTASDAQREATAAANKVVEFVVSKGVKKEDIKTNYSINPKYNYTKDRGQVLTGYEVRQSITLKIRDLDSISGILSGVVERGANEVGNLSFTIDNPDALKAEARVKAIKDAKEKADALSKDLGVRLGRIVNFNESGGEVPMPMYEKFGFGGAAPAADPIIMPGQNEIVSNISITYEIR